MIFPVLGAAAAAYLLGAVPTAYLMVRLLRGQDIRKLGSGNVGATNVFRVAGRGPGIVTFALDAAKGWAATAWVPGLFSVSGDWTLVVCFMAAVCGHNWPVFLGFRGGKGVAVSAGALMGLNVKVFALAFALWGAVFLASGYVSLASIAAAAALPALMFWLEPSSVLGGFALVLAALVIYKHRSNIGRLIAGTENKAGFKRCKKEK